MSSQVVGSSLAGLGAFIFFYYSTWIFITPFISNTHWLQDYFIDRIWAVRIPQYLLLAGISVLLLLVVITLMCTRKQKVA